MPLSACSAAPRAGKKGAVDRNANLLPLAVPELCPLRWHLVWAGSPGARLHVPGRAGAAVTISEPTKAIEE